MQSLQTFFFKVRRGFRCMNVSPVLPSSGLTQGDTGLRRSKTLVGLKVNTTQPGNGSHRSRLAACAMAQFA